ncbi:hypothetical protein [Paenibacillus sp. SYP-B4298]|uniref:hypothetical protein n=1 Tax=Paenibacillus sp. SYP-B4298 TaxID=2996034 RepID=UPI0022DD58EE|nr:hypothetical protein [Paenibacillus sp. SYP-B4298]
MKPAASYSFACALGAEHGAKPYSDGERLGRKLACAEGSMELVACQTWASTA